MKVLVFFIVMIVKLEFISGQMPETICFFADYVGWVGFSANVKVKMLFQCESVSHKHCIE